MTGRTHALTGVGGGCLLAGALPGPVPARVVALLLVVLGALAPDIDHEGATRSSTRLIVGALAGLLLLPLAVWPPAFRTVRALLAGLLLLVALPVAVGVHHGTIAGGRAIFRATATSYDEDPWNDGHRLITHTVAGTVVAGAVVAAGTALGGWWLGGGLGAGILGAWWLWGLAFAWGCLVHVLGDTCTVQGCPLAWPLKIRGKRWWLVRAPLTVHAGGDGERRIVVPVAWAGTVAAALWMFGLWGPILSVVAWMAGSLE